MFKGWSSIEEITKLCTEDNMCWIIVKTEIWGITMSKWSFIITSLLFVPPYIGSIPPLGNIHYIWWKLSLSTCVLKESDQGFSGKVSIAFESKYHQFCSAFSSNDAYPLPWKFTEGNCEIAGVCFIKVEELIRNFFNDKILSILSSKENLHKNGKASPRSSEYSWLNLAPHGQASGICLT